MQYTVRHIKHVQKMNLSTVKWAKCHCLKDPRSRSGNYRPVSLTCVLCKVLESIIRDGLVDYLESAGLIRDTQLGFRKGRSCLSNLLCFLD